MFENNQGKGIPHGEALHGLFPTMGLVASSAVGLAGRAGGSPRGVTPTPDGLRERWHLLGWQVWKNTRKRRAFSQRGLSIQHFGSD